MGYYVTVADVRAEGVPSTVSDARINSRIVKWETIVEQVSGNVFRELSPGELIFDGNNRNFLHFNLPLISVTSIKINGETTELDPLDYRAFVGRQKPQDDRRNPKIRLTPIRDSIYRTQPGIFVKGLEQKITATWGFLEPDNSVPQPIIDAIVQLVALDVNDYFSSGAAGSSAYAGGITTPLRRERTDGHELEYMDAEDQKIMYAMIPSDILDLIRLYRAPTFITSPEPILYTSDPGITVVCA